MSQLLLIFVSSMILMLVIFLIVVRTCNPRVLAATIWSALGTLSLGTLYLVLNDGQSWPWCPCGKFSAIDFLVMLAGIAWDCFGLFVARRYTDPAFWMPPPADDATTASEASNETEKSQHPNEDTGAILTSQPDSS